MTEPKKRDKITTTGLASRDFPYSSPGRVWASRVGGCGFESPGNPVL